jgi:2-keto-4-pentenoate hydratase/2-oxohepta-3-ene-1,7-dioic acid hydratase in catechol pathway
MKLAYFNDFTLGVVTGERIVDVTSVVSDIPRVGPHDLISSLIERFANYRPRLEQAAAVSEGVPLAAVRLRPPLPKPGKILCMAGNYLENGTLAEARPINAFLKSTRAAIGDGDTIVLPDAPATVFHHEGEAGLVFGKRASHVKAAEAYDHVFGYMNFIDASARGLGPEGADGFFMGKSWHSFAPIGPFLVTADEIADPQDLHLRLWVDGDLRQDYSTSDMGHNIPETIEWATSIATFNPGDVLSLGTNHQGLGPLQQGSRVEMEIEGLGRLHVSVTDRLAREWPKGVDRTIADRVAGRTP